MFYICEQNGSNHKFSQKITEMQMYIETCIFSWGRWRWAMIIAPLVNSCLEPYNFSFYCLLFITICPRSLHTNCEWKMYYSKIHVLKNKTFSLFLHFVPWFEIFKNLDSIKRKSRIRTTDKHKDKTRQFKTPWANLEAWATAIPYIMHMTSIVLSKSATQIMKI